MARTITKKPSAKKSGKRKEKQGSSMRPEILGVIIIALGILLAVSFFTTAAGPAGRLVKDFFMGYFMYRDNIFCVKGFIYDQF